MFYLNAKSNYDVARQAHQTADEAAAVLKSMAGYSQYVAFDLGEDIDDPDYDDEEAERIGDNERIFHEAYKQYVQSIVAAQIFCVACLEAHINSRALDGLTGKMAASFDKISLEGKWLMFPKLVGLDGFDPGRQPFQNFSLLIHTRNSLVHHKARSTNVLESLEGLSLDDAQLAIKTTRDLISELAHKLGEPSPQWLGENAPFLVFDKRTISNS